MVLFIKSQMTSILVPRIRSMAHLHECIQALPLCHDGRHAGQVAAPHSLTPLLLRGCQLKRGLCNSSISP